MRVRLIIAQQSFVKKAIAVFVGVNAVFTKKITIVALIQKSRANIHKRATCLISQLDDGFGIKLLIAIDHLHIAQPAQDAVLIQPVLLRKPRKIPIGINGGQGEQNGT